MCIGPTRRKLIAAGIVREWKPKLKVVFREADPFVVAVAGEVDQVAMEAQLVHQNSHWRVQTDCSNIAKLSLNCRVDCTNFRNVK